MEQKIKAKEAAQETQLQIPKVENTTKSVFAIFGILVLGFIIVLLIICIVIAYINLKSTNIHNGIYVKGVNISNLSKEEAKSKLKQYFNENIPEEIVFKTSNYEASIPTSLLDIDFHIDEQIETAYNMCREGNIFVNTWNSIMLNFNNLNIEPVCTINEEQLRNFLADMSVSWPEKVIESSYYIEGNNLIITKGKQGNEVNIEEMIPYIKSKIENLELKEESLAIYKTKKDPEPIDIDKIHNEIYKEAKDAYYTQNPFAVYPSEDGLDFDISIEEAKNIVQQDAEEYTIPIKILYPNVKTSMIGMEAFPDLLSTFSTNYQVSNTNRTTNLILAANKINGTVLMPGEVFSYNKVVGERTISAGYKEAPIYVSGRVEDGLGGGICQITTTLYNAVVLANLEIVERTNHQFVPSYVGASRDATVVYGAIDFKFKNNRDYPIKIQCSVSGGVANFTLYGLKTDNDYDVEITTKIIGSTANAIYSQGYKTLKKNGQVISTEVLSNDTYKKH